MSWLIRNGQLLLTVSILILVALAAFQMGRLSVFYSGPSDFKIETI